MRSRLSREERRVSRLQQELSYALLAAALTQHTHVCALASEWVGANSSCVYSSNNRHWRLLQANTQERTFSRLPAFRISSGTSGSTSLSIKIVSAISSVVGHLIALCWELLFVLVMYCPLLTLVVVAGEVLPCPLRPRLLRAHPTSTVPPIVR